MSEEGQKQGIEVPPAQALIPQRISMPDFIDWHMIFDYELDQLSQLETGVLGSVGFVALGAALGCVGQFSEVFSKLRAVPQVPLAISDIVYVAVFIGSAVTAIICLALFGVSKWRNSGLTTKIRARKRHNLTTSFANAEKP